MFYVRRNKYFTVQLNVRENVFKFVCLPLFATFLPTLCVAQSAENVCGCGSSFMRGAAMEFVWRVWEEGQNVCGMRLEPENIWIRSRSSSHSTATFSLSLKNSGKFVITVERDATQSGNLLSANTGRLNTFRSASCCAPSSGTYTTVHYIAFMLSHKLRAEAVKQKWSLYVRLPLGKGELYQFAYTLCVT